MFVVIVEVDINDDKGKDEYFVELIRSSFVIEIELNNDSVNSERVVGASVYSIVILVVTVETVDHVEDNDSVELATVSLVID